ncbi:Ig-like domain-containing protein [Candidatus Colwellia aromaticivorans]|uniref:Ig-like domain-containing protein n=1 Tax=Candidatus Colwellia aromaticivorans TaxID=2267621 RepID=UPI000DF3F998|nr:Ig-like domain-containing protein [Candidatus Colwellia aromaticivorans]
MDIGHRLKRISLICLLVLFWIPTALAEILVDSRNIVSSARVSRTDVQYTNTLNLSNTEGSFSNVVITVSSNSPNTVIVDNQITVGDYLSTANMTTTNTFSFRHNRRFAFDPNALQYQIDFILIDEQPPSVEITSPIDNQLFSNSPITVLVDATDNVGVETVTVNGIAANFDGPNFSAIVPINIGLNTLIAEATDAAGNTSTNSITVERSVPDDIPPDIDFLSPNNGDSFNQSPASVSITATDNVGIASVTVNGFNAVFDGTNFNVNVPLVEGSNTLIAQAIDTSGNLASASIDIELVVLDGIPPTLNILSPQDGDTVNESPVVVSVEASDDVAVASVTVNGVPADFDGTNYNANVPLIAGNNTITATAKDAAENSASRSIDIELVSLDSSPPTVEILSPDDGSIVGESPVNVSVSANDDIAIDTVVINGINAISDGTNYNASIPLNVGANTILAIATDTSTNAANVQISVTLDLSVGDVTPPTISILAPFDGALLINNLPELEIIYADNVAIDENSLQISMNGSPVATNCNADTSDAFCVFNSALPDGDITLSAQISDTAGNSANTQINFIVDVEPIAIAVSSPLEGLITILAEILVEGTISDNAETVRVNGVDATINNGQFSALVPLREGKNMLVAVGTKASGRTGTDSVDITRDNIAPIVVITSPSNAFVSVNNTVDVTGQVNDIVNGAVNPTVYVNGIQATVASGSFLATSVPLVNGPNTIEAIATDQVGNQGTHQIDVTFTMPAGARMSQFSGSGQASEVTSQLVQPLVAQVLDSLGNPVAGRLVKFEVTRNNGGVSPIMGQPLMRVIQIPTDGSGKAQVFFTLGATAGEGNNRVKATAVGVVGEVEFCATALTQPADKILMTNGDNQRGLVGSPLPNPLEALVVDIDGNPIEGIQVTFAVVKGNGNLDGNSTLVKQTGTDGVARAVLTLSLEPGINNNVVNATFVGLARLPATFTSSGLTPGLPEDTAFKGVVLDSGLTAIPGAVVSIPNSTATGITNAEGFFLLENVPIGKIDLEIDPTSSPRPETFPVLHFETVTVAGQQNDLGMPIILPAIQTQDSKLVGGNDDVVIAMSGVAGLNLTVFANSVTFPNGDSTGQLTISQVHLDKVPMPPPSGTFFMPPAWTVQPAGVKFNPPAKISIPNDGLPPGRVIDIFQFDHALNEFINIGKGTVSEDASVIVSDPGFGITRAGWGGCGQPQPPTTCAAKCGPCQKCEDNACVTDTGKDGNACADGPQSVASNGVTYSIDDSCRGVCDNGTCKDSADGFNVKKLLDALKEAGGKAFSACMKEPLKKKITDFLKDKNFKVKCSSTNPNCGGAAPGSNTLTLGKAALDVAGCQDLASSTLHEIVHAAGGQRHRKCKADGTVLGEIACTSGADCKTCIDPDTDKAYGCEASCYPVKGSKVGKATACK